MAAVQHVSTKEEASTWNFPLGIPGFRFADLNRVRRLADLDACFLDTLDKKEPGLGAKLKELRVAAAANNLPPKYTDTLISVGEHFGPFLAALFRIEDDVKVLDAAPPADQIVFECRKGFFERRVWKNPPSPELTTIWDLTALESAYRDVVNSCDFIPPLESDPELEFATVAVKLSKVPAGPAKQDADRKLEAVAAWGRALAFHPKLRARVKEWALVIRPEKIDFDHLVETRKAGGDIPTLVYGPAETQRHRDGFALTDSRYTQRQATGETNYCLNCHPREKDSCRNGLKNTDGSTPKNPLGIPLSGCPLDEKISEMHQLKREGHSLGALAMIMIDNPLCAGTGHRICNDCMKSCIYQKQTPVNIPQTETRILTDVLNLPYGFEIYALLTRWNPLNLRRPYPLPYNGKNVLVVGMGPAGYTLGHYLLNEGFGVVGIEGLKVEPLPPRLLGNKRHVPQPIKDVNEIVGPLNKRTTLGFGGVSEYGITVRWDKNFLDINHLVMMRRKKFRLFSGVRFGGTLSIDDCWNLGIDHIAIATGAGKPTLARVKNNLIRGVRAASDFLMGLQGTGIHRKDSLGNLQVELPALVIGGGLTAVDTATELMAYYVVQVEKTLERFERIAAQIGDDEARKRFDPEETATLVTFLRHGREVRAERAAAKAAGRDPNFTGLVRNWGGVKLVYRKSLKDSPAYRNNHEEIVKALEEGIGIADCLNPVEFISGPTGALAAVKFEGQRNDNGKWFDTGDFLEMPAKTVMVAAGTRPNTMYGREHPGVFAMDDNQEFYRGHKLVEDGAGWRLEPVAKRGETGFFTSYNQNGKLISFYGDNHPIYAGNVVKAMASARDGHREVVRAFSKQLAALKPEDQTQRELDWACFAEGIEAQLKTTVVNVVRLTRNIVEVVVRAPLAARNFQPGQFFRLQNFERFAERVEGFPLAMEGLALTGAWVDQQRGLLSMIVLEMGGSSRLVQLLEPGEDVIVMGPTGKPTEIPQDETVLLAGGGLGNAVMFSIAAALKEKNNRVLYFAGYKRADDLFKRSEIERSCDLVVWSVDAGTPIPANRPQDRSYVGTIVGAMEAYVSGKLGPVTIPIKEVDRIITIGSNNMMDAVKTARRKTLGEHLPNHAQIIGSINSPMQCMMKEICAQCLQRHVDPATGKEQFIFSCFNQDQPLEVVDFKNLSARLRQNSMAEKLTALWLDHLFKARVTVEA